MNISIDEDPFARNAQGSSKIYHEVIILMIFLQTKPLIKNMNNKYSDLYYTVTTKIDEKETVNNKNEKKTE